MGIEEANNAMYVVAVGVSFWNLMTRWATHCSIKQHCLKLYVNGLGFRAIERVTGVNHNTIINWVKKAGNSLPEGADYSEIPEVCQVDELPTFVGKKKQNLGTAVNKGDVGILAGILGERSSATFKKLWQIIKCWHCFFYCF